jgi:hypothetical protein
MATLQATETLTTPTKSSPIDLARDIGGRQLTGLHASCQSRLGFSAVDPVAELAKCAS